jgi:hypothetical protein
MGEWSGSYYAHPHPLSLSPPLSIDYTPRGIHLSPHCIHQYACACARAHTHTPHTQNQDGLALHLVRPDLALSLARSLSLAHARALSFSLSDFGDAVFGMWRQRCVSTVCAPTQAAPRQCLRRFSAPRSRGNSSSAKSKVCSSLSLSRSFALSLSFTP